MKKSPSLSAIVKWCPAAAGQILNGEGKKRKGFSMKNPQYGLTDHYDGTIIRDSYRKRLAPHRGAYQSTLNASIRFRPPHILTAVAL